MKKVESHAARTTQYFRDLLEHLFRHGGDYSTTSAEARNAATVAGLNSSDMQAVMTAKWCDLVRDALGDHILTEEEESRLVLIRRHFSINGELPVVKAAHERLVKAAILRDLKNRLVKTRCHLDQPLPFRLQAREIVIWAFKDVSLHEQITKRHTIGGSNGASLKVMKGLYLRLGAFKATPISWEETQKTGTGLLVLTNKHFYFSGGRRNLKIPFSRLALIEPVETSVRIQKDNETAKPLVFSNVDGWFAFNIVQLA